MMKPMRVRRMFFSNGQRLRDSAILSSRGSHEPASRVSLRERGGGGEGVGERGGGGGGGGERERGEGERGREEREKEGGKEGIYKLKLRTFELLTPG